MTNKPKKNKLFYFLSIVISIFLIELILQLAGVAYNYIQKKYNPEVNYTAQENIILCLGESTTAWGLGESYPAQLQKLLNEKYGKDKFKVINEGRSATNTSIILEKLDSLLIQYKPSVIITLMGINDYWGISADNSVWSQIKLVKFFKLLQINLRQKKESSLLVSDKINNPKIPLSAPESTLNYNPESIKLAQLALQEFENKNYLKAKKIYLDAKTFKPYLDLIDFKLGEIFLNLNNLRQAEIQFKNYVGNNPSATKFTEVGNIYYNFYGVFHQYGQTQARLYYKQALALSAQKIEALIYLGCSYLHLDNNIPTALGYLEKAYALGSKNSALIGSLADIYLKLDNKNKAEKILQDNLTDFTIWSRLLAYYLQEKNYEQFNHYIEQALETYPENRAFLNMQEEAALLTGKAPNHPIKKYDTRNFYEYQATIKNYLLFNEKINKYMLQWVLVQYPHRPIAPFKELFNVHNNILFVETTQAMQDAELKSGYNAIYIDNFAENFGHFTPAGAKIFAAEVLKAIEKVNQQLELSK